MDIHKIGIHRARVEFVRGGGSLEVLWKGFTRGGGSPWGQFNVCF